jgi:hypothetical protein
MDLLAPILAYFGTVTAMIVAVMMSYDAFIYRPLYSLGPPNTVAVAATPAGAKPAVNVATKNTRAGSATVRPQLADVSHGAAAKQRIVRRTTRIARGPHTRWPLREARVWARPYQLPSDLERDAFGYAQAPFGSGDDPFQ